MTSSPHLYVVPDDDSSDEQQPNNGRKNEGNRLVEFLEPLVKPIAGIDGQQYVAFKERPHIAKSHDGTNSAAMQEICSRSMLETNRWPSGTAKAVAADYLQAECLKSPALEVQMRADYRNGSIYLDTAWPSGQVIQVSPSAVNILDTCDSVFTRSGVTAGLPNYVDEPIKLTSLLKYVRISEDGLPVLLACLINSLMTNLPQPVVLIHGPAAAGKTTALRLLLDLVDPSTQMPGGTLTGDERVLRALSKVRRTFVFDNVSYVKGDVSDVLAKITTGSEMISRALFQNSTPDVIELRRPVFINGIMSGFARSDLASRSVSFLLSPIKPAARLASSQLLQGWEEDKPKLFSELLRLASYVLSKLPTEPQVESRYRNPEFVQITNIIGNLLNLDGLSYLEKSISDLSDAVIGASPMGYAFAKLAECISDGGNPCHEGRPCEAFGKSFKANELRDLLVFHYPIEAEKDIPLLPKNFGENLSRIESDIEEVLGIRVVKTRKDNLRIYRLEKI